MTSGLEPSGGGRTSGAEDRSNGNCNALYELKNDATGPSDSTSELSQARRRKPEPRCAWQAERSSGACTSLSPMTALLCCTSDRLTPRYQPRLPGFSISCSSCSTGLYAASASPSILLVSSRPHVGSSVLVSLLWTIAIALATMRAQPIPAESDMTSPNTIQDRKITRGSVTYSSRVTLPAFASSRARF